MLQNHGITGRVTTRYLALNLTLFIFSLLRDDIGVFTIQEPSLPQTEAVLLMVVWSFRCRVLAESAFAPAFRVV